MTVQATIRQKLEDIFLPESLEVQDVSEQHRGHGGWREGGETHFHVVMVSRVFDGQTRISRQRAVYKALSEEMAGPVHALSLNLKAPGEA